MSDFSDYEDDDLSTAASRRMSDIQSILSDEFNRSKCDDNHLQSTLREILVECKKRGEETLVIEKKEDIENGIELATYLERFGPFPLGDYVAARILKDITASLFILHRHKLSVGVLNISTVFLDRRMRAHIVAGPNLQEAKGLDEMGEVKDCLAGDMFRLGFLLYRLVTGMQPHFEDNALLPLPHRSFKISPAPKMLAELLMSKFVNMRPKAGDVIYNKWAESAALLPEQRVHGVHCVNAVETMNMN